MNQTVASRFRVIAGALAILMAVPAFAADTAAAPAPASPAQDAPAPVLRIVLGETKPPYVVAEQRRGIEYRIVTALLDAAGYRYSVQFAPNKRAQLLLAGGEADAVIGGSGGYLSAPYIAYKNMAITLCERHIQLAEIADLARYRVAAFQNASLFLGPEYAHVAGANREYHEVSPQIGINRLLYGGRVDVAISDINIFQYFSRELDDKFRPGRPLCAYPLFPPTLYRLSFAHEVQRDRFNAALKQMLKGSLYEDVAREYGIALGSGPVSGEPYFKPPPDSK